MALICPRSRNVERESLRTIHDDLDEYTDLLRWSNDIMHDHCTRYIKNLLHQLIFGSEKSRLTAFAVEGAQRSS